MGGGPLPPFTHGGLAGFLMARSLREVTLRLLNADSTTPSSLPTSLPLLMYPSSTSYHNTPDNFTVRIEISVRSAWKNLCAERI